MKRLFLIFIAALLTACSSSSSDRVSFSAPKLPPPGALPSVFKKYSVDGDSVLTTNWTRDFDMSGVSFDKKQTCTLITRRHVIMANHYRRNPGSKVVFHDRNGKRLERIVVSIKKVMGDAAVGVLNIDVPAGYKIYPLPAPRDDFSNLTNRYAAVTDQNRRLFFHRVGGVVGNRIFFQHDHVKRHGWGKKLVSGDSGNPSFLISGNELVLIETHHTGGPGAGPFYGNRELQERLRKAISDMTPGYTFRTKSL